MYSKLNVFINGKAVNPSCRGIKSLDQRHNQKQTPCHSHMCYKKRYSGRQRCFRKDHSEVPGHNNTASLAQIGSLVKRWESNTPSTQWSEVAAVRKQRINFTSGRVINIAPATTFSLAIIMHWEYFKSKPFMKM